MSERDRQTEGETDKKEKYDSVVAILERWNRASRREKWNQSCQSRVIRFHEIASIIGWRDKHLANWQQFTVVRTMGQN